MRFISLKELGSNSSLNAKADTSFIGVSSGVFVVTAASVRANLVVPVFFADLGNISSNDLDFGFVSVGDSRAVVVLKVSPGTFIAIVSVFWINGVCEDDFGVTEFLSTCRRGDDVEGSVFSLLGRYGEDVNLSVVSDSPIVEYEVTSDDVVSFMVGTDEVTFLIVVVFVVFLGSLKAKRAKSPDGEDFCSGELPELAFIVELCVVRVR